MLDPPLLLYCLISQMCLASRITLSNTLICDCRTVLLQDLDANSGSRILSKTLYRISLPPADLRLRKAIQQGIYYQKFRSIARNEKGHYSRPFLRASSTMPDPGYF